MNFSQSINDLSSHARLFNSFIILWQTSTTSSCIRLCAMYLAKSSSLSKYVVISDLSTKGKEVFCNVTQANINKPMAIFVGGNLLTAPNIQSKICGGTAEINGSFTSDSARQLSNALNEGTLPAPLILMQEEKISPSLGDNALT